MATINNNEDFALAVAYLIDTGNLPVQGERFLDRNARKVWDERPSGNVDITPAQATLETALDNMLAKMATENQLISAQMIALSQARDYLKHQLLNASPNMTNIYLEVKKYVDDNSSLLQMVTNQLALMRNAYSIAGIVDWTVNLISPTAVDRARYLMAVELVIALLS